MNYKSEIEKILLQFIVNISFSDPKAKHKAIDTLSSLIEKAVKKDKKKKKKHIHKWVDHNIGALKGHCECGAWLVRTERLE